MFLTHELRCCSPSASSKLASFPSEDRTSQVFEFAFIRNKVSNESISIHWSNWPELAGKNVSCWGDKVIITSEAQTLGSRLNANWFLESILPHWTPDSSWAPLILEGLAEASGAIGFPGSLSNRPTQRSTTLGHSTWHFSGGYW